jgi:hypothetical protein
MGGYEPTLVLPAPSSTGICFNTAATSDSRMPPREPATYSSSSNIPDHAVHVGDIIGYLSLRRNINQGQGIPPALTEQ